ncbi:MAG: magnesium transporter [Nitrososphaerota archaeon]|nr:magnesium transporter [Nitrososphaerota archaeon]MDG6960430.1 magnesium transporter [Nitrososphaerota archaeon]MDG6980552.1 magnesium transporter [Nitrososphaerota archaeon]
MTKIIGAWVRTKSGVKLGKLKDFVFVDDPKYAEVTTLIIGRPFGDPSLKVPWSSVVGFEADEIVVRDAPDGGYAEVGPEEDLLLLKDKLLDKKILDTEGLAVEVVYDLQLLLVENKLFMVAADVSGRARMRRLGLGRLGGGARKRGEVEDFIPWKYVQPLEALTPTKGFVKLTVARDRLREIHPEDVADILEELDRDQRIHVFDALDSKAAAGALEAAEPRVQREILADTNMERIAQIFAHLSAVEIAEIISVLPRSDAVEFMKTLSPDRVVRVRELITQHEVSASVLATRHFLGFPGDLTVEDAFVRFRKEAPSSLVNMYIYIVDDEKHLKGVIDINELVQAPPNSKLEDFMVREVVMVAPSTSRGGLEALFKRYRFRAIPVVDDEGKLMGVVREKDAFSTGDEIRLAR